MAATRTKHVDRATSVGGTNLKNSILAFNLETNNEMRDILLEEGRRTYRMITAVSLLCTQCPWSDCYSAVSPLYLY